MFVDFISKLRGSSLRRWLIALATSLVASMACAGTDDRPLNIYLNADLTHTRDLTESLFLGLQAGLTVGQQRFDGPDIAIHLRDHRNNLRRTEQLIADVRDDPHLLAIVGGMHTPHYLKFGPQLNEAGLVLMLPWSAGAALTRLSEGASNHVFRVSVDDKQAAPFLAERADWLGCTRLATLAIDNGWGRGNSAALEIGVPALGMEIVHQGFARQDIGYETMAAEIAEMEVAAPDCLIFVMQGKATALAVDAVAQWETPPRILSHWGIFDGEYVARVAPEAHDALDIAILATCVLSIQGQRAPQITEAIKAAQTYKPGLAQLGDIASPLGFAHAYDVGLLLHAAVHQMRNDVQWNQGQKQRSAGLREALEALEQPVEGMLKTYQTPFKPVAAQSPDGHEALDQSDLCLARLHQNGAMEAYVRKRQE